MNFSLVENIAEECFGSKVVLLEGIIGDQHYMMDMVVISIENFDSDLLDLKRKFKIDCEKLYAEHVKSNIKPLN